MTSYGTDVGAPDNPLDRERTATRSHVVLVALASLALAWAGFQASEWTRERLDASDESAALREESNQLNARADRLEQQDTMLYVQYLLAAEAGRQEEAAELFDLLRPELQAYVRSAPTNDNGVPLSPPFDSPGYDAQEIRQESERVREERQDVDGRGAEASRNVARYGAMGVFFAVSLVVAGISSRFEDPYRRVLHVLARTLLAIGLVLLVLTPMSFRAP